MPYDITVQSVAYLPSHQANEDGSIRDDMKSQAYFTGDVVDVYKLIESAPHVDGRLAFAHVTGVPDHVPFDEIREELTKTLNEREGEESQRMVLRRLWKLDLSALTDDHLLGIRGRRVMHTDWRTFASSYWFFDLSEQLVNQWPR